MSFIVKPLSAQLAQDHDTFGKSDPYCVVTIGNQKQRSKTHNGGGQQPKWQDTLTLNTNDTSMKVEVYDDDVGKDDYIGQGTVFIGHLVGTGKSEVMNIDLISDKKKPAGKVQVQVRYNGPQQQGGFNQPQQQGGNNQPQQGGNQNWGGLGYN